MQGSPTLLLVYKLEVLVYDGEIRHEEREGERREEEEGAKEVEEAEMPGEDMRRKLKEVGEEGGKMVLSGR